MIKLKQLIKEQDKYITTLQKHIDQYGEEIILQLKKLYKQNLQTLKRNNIINDFKIILRKPTASKQSFSMMLWYYKQQIGKILTKLNNGSIVINNSNTTTSFTCT